MDEKMNKEEIESAITKAKEKMKEDTNFFKSKRKIALTWNIIFFIGILSTTIITSILTKTDSLNFKILTDNLADKKDLLTAMTGLIISFLTGILGSYFKSKRLNNETEFNIKDFVKEAYLNRIDKSNLNPK